MSLKDWRTKRRMADPVHGEFRVSGSYFPHPGSTPMRTMLTGVIVADGIPAAPAERMDRNVLGEFRRSLPVLVDRAEPKPFVVLWDKVVPMDARAEARECAEVDAQTLRLDNGQTLAQKPVPETVTSVADLPAWLQTCWSFGWRT